VSEKERNVIEDKLRVFVVPLDILKMNELSIYEKMVYIVLRSFVNPHELKAFPSYKTIAELGGMSLRKAKDSVQKLVEFGLIQKQHRFDVSVTDKKNPKIRFTSNLYTLENPSAPHAPRSAPHAPRSAPHAPRSAPHAPKQIHLTDPFITNPFNISVNPKLHAWFEELRTSHADRLTEIVEVYETMKHLEGLTEDIFILATLKTIKKCKKREGFKIYLEKTLRTEIAAIDMPKEKKLTRARVPEYIQAQIERDRQEEKQREMEQLRGSKKVDQEELDRLIAELEGSE